MEGGLTGDGVGIAGEGEVFDDDGVAFASRAIEAG